MTPTTQPIQSPTQSPSQSQINRRSYERFAVKPGYTSASIRIDPNEIAYGLEGYVYDLSEGGIRFDLDTPIESGRTISMRINLPGIVGEPDERAVFVTGEVVWCDVDETGDAKMAMSISKFDRDGDKQRLIRAISCSGYQRAA